MKSTACTGACNDLPVVVEPEDRLVLLQRRGELYKLIQGRGHLEIGFYLYLYLSHLTRHPRSVVIDHVQGQVRMPV